MREIKFRAKAIKSNEWKFGFLTCTHFCCDGYDIMQLKCGKYNAWYRVDEKTIGEFTGLSDINGKDIYEGDILKYVGEDYKDWHTKPYVIKWDSDEACFECVCPGNFMMATVWKDMEIIGNIYDNPELLLKVE
jgi:uncharacterized phage protein (TIGR01671 family)